MDYTIFFDVISAVIGDRDGLGVIRPENFDGNGDYEVTFWWKLNGDPQRPNKRSKSLVIAISHEALEDFKDAPKKLQTQAIDRLSQILTAKLTEFDPDHDAPHGAEEPKEKWVIRSENIL